jgi:hypothetical protein
MPAEVGSINNDANSNTAEWPSYNIAPDRDQFFNEYFVSEGGVIIDERKVDLVVEVKTQYDPDTPYDQQSHIGSWKSYHINHVYRIKLRDAFEGQPEEIRGTTRYGQEVVLWGIVDGKSVNPTRIFDNDRYNANQKRLNLSGKGFINLLNRLFKKK